LLIQEIASNAEFTGQWETVPGSTVTALTKRAAIGVILALAPVNYPINESYSTILPALLMGNIVILKIPAIGGLAHLLTMQAFAKALPAGTMNFISGSGRTTMPPLMKTGLIDGLAFIGGYRAADELIHAHPHPHRLHTFLQLEAKNMAILLEDLFEPSSKALLDNAVSESILGSLSFNGQRCTALKLLFVPRSHADTFVTALVERVEAMAVGLPWQFHSNATTTYSQITPLPTRARIEYMQSLVADAVAKGAAIVNAGGGAVMGGPDNSTLMVPAVLYPVTPAMKVYHEEQFGPVVPVAVYDDLETVLGYGETGKYAQQVSIFGRDVEAVAKIVDRFGAVFGKINLNGQCGRSPDTLAFSGRRSSAMGVMSVREALREFSVPTVIAYKNTNPVNDEIANGLNDKSVFLGAGHERLDRVHVQM
jgi:glyceraldehyde-3-phosphate dehydrogenase (NADP+)